MSFSVSVTHSLSGSVGINASRQHQGGVELALDPVIPAGATNQLVLAAIDISQVKCLALYCDKALTVKTNSSGAPTNTINLLAGIPYIWEMGGYETYKITADVTALYLTNAETLTSNSKSSRKCKSNG